MGHVSLSTFFACSGVSSFAGQVRCSYSRCLCPFHLLFSPSEIEIEVALSMLRKCLIIFSSFSYRKFALLGRSLFVYRLVHAPVICVVRAKAGFDSQTESFGGLIFFSNGDYFFLLFLENPFQSCQYCVFFYIFFTT